ncbi:MAG: hydroxymethylglutaryl-CoA synthase [Bacteroidota bacterium]
MKHASIGIDDMSLYIPKLYLDIEDLANERNIEYAKLHFGLGLTSMAVPDVHEDAATMAANAVADLIDKNNIDPSAIGRIYMGTESALDGAKPTATYVLEMLRDKYHEQYGSDCFLNCDVVDLTFACVGGVDALNNTLDWVAVDDERIGIVVTTDLAKYELGSTGEYTQGAGAIAMLVKRNPRLLAIRDHWGVATVGVHDFFKPKRTASKVQIIDEVLNLAGIKDINANEIIEKLDASLEVKGVLDVNEVNLTLQKETPVFDGQYSNLCYQERIRQAFDNFRKKAAGNGRFNGNQEHVVTEEWDRLIFHLPYAFHAKRIFPEIFMEEAKRSGTWPEIKASIEMDEPLMSEFADKEMFLKTKAQYLRLVSKTGHYKQFVAEKMEKGQRASREVGNMYACSIFLALMSSLEADYLEGSNLKNGLIGFFGYGSGSKSKVFEGKLQPGWKEVVAGFKVTEQLKKRTRIDYPTYEKLHSGKLEESVVTAGKEFNLSHIGKDGVVEGARYYAWTE